MQSDLHYGVVVGIDRYPALTDLRLARKDAEDFHAWLRDVAKLPADRLDLVNLRPRSRLPRERRGAKPGADQIWDAVFDKMEKVRAELKARPAGWPDTRLYFFFSGHGIAPTPRDASGLAADAGPEHYGNSASIKALVEYLLDSGDFAQLVMVADCCRNKPTRGTMTGRPPWTPRVSSRSEEPRVAQLYAAIYGSAAREPPKGLAPDLQRGHFTKAIMEGLAGHPRAVGVNGVTTASLNAYARARVRELSNGKQTLPNDIGADLVLLPSAQVPATPPTQSRPVRITFPARFRGVVALLDGNLIEVDRHRADGNDWVVPLEPSLYRVRAERASVKFADGGFFEVSSDGGELDVAL